jgi:hypothetical protein
MIIKHYSVLQFWGGDALMRGVQILPCPGLMHKRYIY